jgi:hypothetical protein
MEAWQLRRPRCDLNFSDVLSLEEVEFLAPLHVLSPTRTITATVRRSADSSSPSGRMMQQRREQFSGDVWDEEDSTPRRDRR